jgi:hypothetical protein
MSFFNSLTTESQSKYKALKPYIDQLDLEDFHKLSESDLVYNVAIEHKILMTIFVRSFIYLDDEEDDEEDEEELEEEDEEEEEEDEEEK